MSTTPARPLLEVLSEHVDQVRAQRAAGRVTLSCDCGTCRGRSVTASAARVGEDLTTRQRLEISHTLVTYGYGNSPLAAVMRGRYDVQVPA